MGSAPRRAYHYKCGCGRQIFVGDCAAGREVKCPCCGRVAVLRPSRVVSRGGRKASGERGLRLADEGPATIEEDGPEEICPSCGNPLLPNAVLCVACGFDFRTGKRHQTAGRDGPVLWGVGNALWSAAIKVGGVLGFLVGLVAMLEICSPGVLSVWFGSTKSARHVPRRSDGVEAGGARLPGMATPGSRPPGRMQRRPAPRGSGSVARAEKPHHGKDGAAPQEIHQDSNVHAAREAAGTAGPAEAASAPSGIPVVQPFARARDGLREEERRFLDSIRPRFTVTKDGLFLSTAVYVDGKRVKPSRTRGGYEVWRRGKMIARSATEGTFEVEPGEHLIVVCPRIPASGDDSGYRRFTRRLVFHIGYHWRLTVQRKEREVKTNVKVPFGSLQEAKKFASRYGYGVEDHTGGRRGPVYLNWPYRYTARSRGVSFCAEPRLAGPMEKPMSAPISWEMERRVGGTIGAAADFLLSPHLPKDSGPLTRAAALLRAFKTERSLEALAKASGKGIELLRRSVAPALRAALNDLHSVAKDGKAVLYLRKRSLQLLGKFEADCSHFEKTLGELSNDAALANALRPAACGFFRRVALPELNAQLGGSLPRCAARLGNIGLYLPFLGEAERAALRSFLRSAAGKGDPRLRDRARSLLAILDGKRAANTSRR